MKVVLFFLFITYLLFGAWGMIGYYYIEANTQQAAKSQLGWSIFWLTLVVAILAFILFYIIYRDWAQEQTGGTLFALFVLMTIICGVANIGMVRKINEWFGDRQSFVIEGRVVNKWISYTKRKHRVDGFYVVVETDTGKRYKFKVKRRNYEMVRPGVFFRKHFRVGYYGIIYRKEL